MKINDTTETARDTARDSLENLSSSRIVEPKCDAASVDPFDLESLRLDSSYLNQPVAKKLLTTVPVRRPHKQDFIRVHPAEDSRFLAALVELNDEREVYLVPPPFIPELGENQHFVATLYLYVNRQKIPALWPVKMPTPDGRQNLWHTSAAAAAEKAMNAWIQVVPASGAYQAYEAQVQLSEPEWPEVSFKEILKIAFKDRIVDGPNHLVIKRLRGLV